MKCRSSLPVKAVVIGAYGQDGILLCQELERASIPVEKVGRGDYDLLDRESVAALFSASGRHDVYFLAAIHRSSEAAAPDDCLEDIQASLDLHAKAPATILEHMRKRNCGDRFFFASSSRIFGSPQQSPQNEATPRAPRCIYGITKSAGMDVCRYYRETHGIYTCSGILYNHESSRRPLPFISKKIVAGAVACFRGQLEPLRIGRFDARADWSFALDVVRAMLLSMNVCDPQDFVISSGISHSVRDFARIAFDEVGLDWQAYTVEAAPQTGLSSVEMIGDNRRIIQATGWRPSLSFEEMVRKLVREELATQVSDNG